jgi:hypothetical protein
MTLSPHQSTRCGYAATAPGVWVSPTADSHSWFWFPCLDARIGFRRVPFQRIPEAIARPGPVDDDLPDHDAATMDRLFSRPMPNWSDRTAVAEFAAAGAEILGDDPSSRARPPSAGGTTRRARSPRCRWPTTWARCSPSSTARRAGASGWPSSRSRRWWCTVAATRSPRRQRRGARTRGPRCAAARTRTGRDGDPPCGSRRGRGGDARALGVPGQHVSDRRLVGGNPPSAGLHRVRRTHPSCRFATTNTRARVAAI